MTFRLTLALLASSVALPALAQDAVLLDEITLEAESGLTLTQDGYVASQSRQATKLDTPIAEIPQAVTIVTQDQIEDQAPRTLNETLSYSAAANPNNYGFDSRFDAFTLRGFPAFYTGIFRDGLRQYNAPTAIYKQEPYGIEGLAILKGPSSALYGVSGPGGIVNLVTKRPKDDPYHELALETGANDRAQIAGDWSGPLSEDSPFSYRLTGLVRRANSNLAGYKDDKTYFAPALRYDNGTTRATILAEVSRSVTGGTAGFYNPAPGEVSDIYSGDPDYNDFTQDQWRFGYEIAHDLNDSVTLRHSARLSSVEIDLEYSGWYAAGAGLNRYWGHYLEAVDTATVDTGLSAYFRTGAIEHELLAGIDVTHAEYDAHSLIGYVSAASTDAADVPYANGQKTTQTGAYLHDQLSWGNWRGFASLRWDRVRTTSIAADRSESEQRDIGRSGRLGVSYRWDGGLVAYANVATSFAPNLGVVYDDVTTDVSRPAKPTKGTQQEIGLKYAPEGSNLMLSAAFYQIKQRDGVVLDASTGRNKQRQLDMTSRGVELEAMANWQNGFSAIASFTHQKVEIDKGAAGTVGKELSGTPRNALSLWGRYEWQDGPAQGLGVGLGLRHVGKSYGDDQNTIRNDARSFVDAQISYEPPQLDGLRMQLNVKNLLDQRDSTCTAGYCYRDEGRVWSASLSKRF